MFATSTRVTAPPAARSSSSNRVPSGVLQRKCSCGASAGPAVECAECKRRREHGEPGLQAKLRVSQPGDRYEQEADRVADAAIGSPQRGVQRQQLSRTGESPADSLAVTGVVDEVLHSAGRPLDRSVRSLMESRLGHDFSQVRVHSDARADESVRAVQARAYTVGRDVVFGAGEYRPDSTAGQRLLAHELVHVVQQGGAAKGAGASGIRESVSAHSTAMLMRGVPGDEWADWCSPCILGTKMCHAEADIAPERCTHVIGSFYKCPCK